MRKFILESLKMALLEYQIVDAEYYKDRIELTVGDIDYFVYFVPHGFVDGYLKYNLTFRPADGGFSDNVNRGPRHAIELINNVAHHAFKVAGEKKIRYIEFSGIKDKKREDDTDDLNNIRSRWYKNFIEKKYGSDVLSTLNDEFLVDVSKILTDIQDWKTVNWEESEVTEEELGVLEEIGEAYSNRYLGKYHFNGETLLLYLGRNMEVEWEMYMKKYGDRIMYYATDLDSDMKFSSTDVEELLMSLYKVLNRAGVEPYKGKRVTMYLIRTAHGQGYKVEGKHGMGFSYTFHNSGVGKFSVTEQIEGSRYLYHLNLTLDDGSIEKNVVVPEEGVYQIVREFEAIFVKHEENL
jgi:hypothetical protein